MRITAYSCERLGYFSQIPEVEGHISPIYRRMHIEELKKINGVGGHTKTPFDCNKEVQDFVSDSSAKPLLSFLKSKSSLNETGAEYNVICRASVLTLMFLRSKDVEMTVTHEGQTIVIEEVPSTLNNENCTGLPGSATITTISQSSISKDESINLRYRNRLMAGVCADNCLTKNPDGMDEDEPMQKAKPNLYIVVKHRFVFVDGTIINLIVSKEIDAVEFRKDDPEKEMVPVDLKLVSFHRLYAADHFVRLNAKVIAMDFLAGGLCYIDGIFVDPKKNDIEKITVMNSWSSIYDPTFANIFKRTVKDFLYTLAKIENRTEFDKITSSTKYVSLLSSTKRQGFPLPDVVYPPNTDRIEMEYDPLGPHHLVIIGRDSSQIPIDNPFYHTDVLTIEVFCKRLFDSFMAKPDCIFVYGNEAECEKVREAMTEKELTLAKYIVN